MEPEASEFESSEMLATFLASTPLLEQSWQFCSNADASAPEIFTVNRVGEVAYVAFSGVQAVSGCAAEGWLNLVEVEIDAKGIFGAFPLRVEGDESVMVHSGMLQVFLSFYNRRDFQNEILEILNGSKSVVFTGHSVGGAVASLAALWLLTNLLTNSHPISVFCITYGSPMIGNISFSQAILQERWVGNFCHVVAKHDLVPRLLFAPPTVLSPKLDTLFNFWKLSMNSPYFLQLDSQMTDSGKTEIFDKVVAFLEVRARGGGDHEKTPFCPFGSFMFCTDEGAICLDNPTAIVEMLYVTIVKGSGTSCVEDHLKYGEYVGKVCWQYLRKRTCVDVGFSESSSEAGIALALQSSGICYREPAYVSAKTCLSKARQLGYRRNLNNAKMAVALSKITPLRAQIEWYKSFCDNSDDQLGYYDSFKRRSASKRGSKVNMNRHKLGQFWDELIEKMETNKLTHDFHKLPKYVNASQFYKLLVEPLEIAEYYRNGEHKKKGNYIEYGREKRFKIFDKWWNDRKVGDEESKPRSRFASLTQDSIFWARVEEAREKVYEVRGEIELGARLAILEKIGKFEEYANGIVNKKEVSKDVLAKNSSYNLFREEWSELKSQMQILPPYFPGFQDRMVQ